MDLAATAVGDPPTKASPGMGVGNVKNKQKKKKLFVRYLLFRQIIVTAFIYASNMFYALCKMF